MNVNFYIVNKLVASKYLNVIPRIGEFVEFHNKEYMIIKTVYSLSDSSYKIYLQEYGTCPQNPICLS